jgi:hypothetical protein
MAEIPPDLKQAERFLKTLDPEADFRSLLDDRPDGFTFQTFDDVKGRKEARLASILHDTLDGCKTALTRLNAQRAGIFVTINETDGEGRKLSNIVKVRAVWVEDDSGLGIKTPLEPHIITETSPGKYHKIFLVNGLTPDQHQQVQNILVAQYGSDPNAKDLARVLRVPGFYHCKGAVHKVKLIRASDSRPYTAAEVLEAFKADPNAALPAKASTTKSSATLAKADYAEIGLSEPLPDITLLNAAQYLPTPGDQNYSEWRDVGMILHHQFRGSDEGLYLFDSWSQDVRNYQGYDDVAAAWSNFGKRTGGPELTFKTLIQAQAVREQAEKSAVFTDCIAKGQTLLDRCLDANLLLDEIAPKLGYLAKGNLSVEKELVDSLMLRYADLKPGKKLTRAEASRAMKQRRGKDIDDAGTVCSVDDPKTPEWARGWVWVSEEETFFNVHLRSVISAGSFRNHFSSEVQDDDGSKDAVRYVLDNNLIPKVMRSMYMPACDKIFKFQGVDCVNTCNTLHRAVVPNQVENQAAVDVFKFHVESICGGWNREAQILCNWFAVAAGQPPRKIRWAPLLIGVVGDGKSVFNEFMNSAIGHTNCKTISSSLIINSAQSGQSGWAEGASFGFIEELKWHGHNRYDAMNALKPYITNDVVPCRKLFKESVTIPNTMNYFATSNYLDGAPLEDGDRRFYALQSRVAKDALGKDYFKILFRALREHTGSILRWLVDLPWHEDFDPDGEAPMTETKMQIINIVADDTCARIAEILEDDDAAEYCPEVILFDSLMSRLSTPLSGIKIDHPRKLQSLLAQMGYAALARVRVNRHRHSIWAKRVNGCKMSLEAAKGIITQRIADAVALGHRDPDPEED